MNQSFRSLSLVRRAGFALLWAALFGLAPWSRPILHGASSPARVSSPPDSFFAMVSERDRDAARAFYRKYLEVEGLPVVAAEVVEDRALQRTQEIVSHLLAGRPDLLQAMADNKMYLIILGRDQVYTDMPEYRNHPDPDFQNERVRGTGGRPTSFGEENLLSLPIDRYDDESIAVHEFCHTIDGTLRSVDPTWRERRNAVFENARSQGLYRGAYAGGNSGEYWAEICQSYFDCNRVNNWNHGPVGTREQLKAYDPQGYELVRTTFRLSPEQDWRYRFVQSLPTITPPPAKFKIDPYYAKFTWAREFVVIGRACSDQALLKANDTIRKMFAYRHDILKALMAEEAKLVVVGREEPLHQLPELAALTSGGEMDALARFKEFDPQSKLIVAAEENVVGDPSQPKTGPCQVIRLMAKAFYHITGSRPVDPNWNNRGRAVQQYELRVKRLDVNFGDRVRSLYATTKERGRWKGTAAMNEPAEYWAAGVLAYFDAAGQDATPPDAPHPIATREALRAYDEDLYALVTETMAYEGHVDWRYRPASR